MHASPTIWVISSPYNLVIATHDQSCIFFLSILLPPPLDRHIHDWSRRFFLLISLSSPLDQPTHDWSLSLSRSTFLFPLIAHSFFLPLSVWLMMMMFNEWFCFESCSLTLYIEILYYKICLEAEVYEKLLEKRKKKAFSECNKTLEYIFQSNFQNTTKHLKIFHFSKNIFTWKYFTVEKYFTCCQTQL